jgi:RNA polymerase sigma factor (sigma-70 family)
MKRQRKPPDFCSSNCAFQLSGLTLPLSVFTLGELLIPSLPGFRNRIGHFRQPFGIVGRCQHFGGFKELLPVFGRLSNGHEQLRANERSDIMQLTIEKPRGLKRVRAWGQSRIEKAKLIVGHKHKPFNKCSGKKLAKPHKLFHKYSRDFSKTPLCVQAKQYPFLEMDSLDDLFLDYRRTGSPETVGRIIKAIYKSVYLGVIRKVRVDDAADLTQNIIIEIVKGLHLFRGVTSREFHGWCYAISRAQIAKHYREKGKHGEGTHLDFDEFSRMVDQNALANNLTESEKRELHEINERLRNADPECYELVFRRHVLENDYKTLGDDYGISAGAARMRVERCIEKYVGGDYV